MSEWKEVKLGDYIDMTNGYAFKSKSFVNRGIPVLKIKNIKTNKIIIEDIDYISADDNNPRYTIIKPNDLIITMTGNRIDGAPETWVGKVALFNLDGKYFLNQRLSIIRVKKDLVNLLFILYSLTTIDAQKYFITHATSSGGQANISPDIVKNFTIKLPSYIIQSEIAGILSSLDAKIETNNKLNDKLEEMAQAIFKSWFVDFEPFKDKPFHETEIGYIPQIFESGVLGDLCTFKRGKGLLSKDAIFGNVPVIAGGMKPACYHNIANTKAPVVTVSGSGANAGYTQIHNVDVWASDCSFIDSNCENLYYVYCFLSRRPKLLRHSQTGAAQPHVKPADIHRFQVVIPTKDVINEFQQIVKPLFDRIGMNKKENDRLASIRDTLLPRLMSGELIV